VEWYLRHSSIHQVVVLRPRRGRLEGYGYESAQIADDICRSGSSVIRSRLEYGIADGGVVAVGKDMVVAQNVALGRNADSMRGRADRSSGQDIVNASGNGPGCDLVMPHAVSALGRANPFGQGLNACIRSIASSRIRISYSQNVCGDAIDLLGHNIIRIQLALLKLLGDQNEHGRLTCRLAFGPFHSTCYSHHIGMRLLHIHEFDNRSLLHLLHSHQVLCRKHGFTFVFHLNTPRFIY